MSLIDALRGHVQRMEGSPYFVAHRDTRTATPASAAAFTTSMDTVENQVQGTPMVTKELVGARDGRAAKRARTFSVSSMLAEDTGGPTGRARQRSFDHGAEALARKEARRGGAAGDEEGAEGVATVRFTPPTGLLRTRRTTHTPALHRRSKMGWTRVQLTMSKTTTPIQMARRVWGRQSCSWGTLAVREPHSKTGRCNCCVIIDYLLHPAQCAPWLLAK